MYLLLLIPCCDICFVCFRGKNMMAEGGGGEISTPRNRVLPISRLKFSPAPHPQAFPQEF